MKESPFSVYDFLGYLIPGMFFNVGLFFIIMLESFNFQLCKGLLKELSSLEEFKADEIFIFVIISYIIGHLISFLSSVSIEKYSIWNLGHPSRYLLKLNVDRNIIKGQKINRVIIRIVCLLFIFPIVSFDFIVIKVFSMKSLIAKPLDPKLIKIIIKKLNKLLQTYSKNLKITRQDKEFDYFRIIYHYVLEKKPNHYPKVQNYVALYGFSRNITMVLNLIILLFSWRVFINKEYTIEIFYIFLCFSLITYLMYLSFNKLYRRFTLESIMASLIE